MPFLRNNQLQKKSKIQKERSFIEMDETPHTYFSCREHAFIENLLKLV